MNGAVSAGATTLPVETTYSWPAAGVFYMAGQRYSYASADALPAQFVGLSPALVVDTRDLTPLVDGSRSYSAMDLTRQALLVDYAEGAFLDALGRNYGMFRFPGLSDDAFRSAIKALAFAPKGTLFTIETVLTYLVGAGNFEVFEDLVNFPNIVFVTLSPAGTDTVVGKTFFGAREVHTLASTTSVVVTYPPVGDAFNSVQAVFLAPDYLHAFFDVKPSAEVETPWTFTGTDSEASAVTLNADGSARLQDVLIVSAGAQYQRTIRALSSSDVFVSATLKVTASSNDDACGIHVKDGSRGIGVGFTPTEIFLYDFGTTTRRGAVTVASGIAHSVELKKRGGIDGPTVAVELWVDGVFAVASAYSNFGATASRTLAFGSFSNGGTSDVQWSTIEAVCLERYTNYWNLRRASPDGSVATATSARLFSTANAFPTALSVLHPLTVRAGVVKHGRNNGRYEVVAVDGGGAFVDLVGVEHVGLDVLASDAVRIPAKHFDAFVAEDAGTQASRTTGTTTSGIVWLARYGGDDGNLIHVELRDPGVPNAVLSVSTSSGPTTAVVHLATDGSSVITSTAAQVKAAVAASAGASAFLNAVLVTEPGGGVMAAAADLALSGGEDGKLLTLLGAGVPANNVTRLIATRIDDRNVLLGSHLAPAGLTPADTARWRKDPNFSTEAALEWELVGTGTVSTDTLTWLHALYASGLDVEVHYATTRTGIVLLNEFDVNDGSFHPFYLADPFAYVRDIVDAITVAGVMPRYR